VFNHSVQSVATLERLLDKTKGAELLSLAPHLAPHIAEFEEEISLGLTRAGLVKLAILAELPCLRHKLLHLLEALTFGLLAALLALTCLMSLPLLRRTGLTRRELLAIYCLVMVGGTIISHGLLPIALVGCKEEPPSEAPVTGARRGSSSPRSRRARSSRWPPPRTGRWRHDDLK
jgi:hypothetical protein